MKSMKYSQILFHSTTKWSSRVHIIAIKYLTSTVSSERIQVLTDLKKRMGGHFANGEYDHALAIATEMRETVKSNMGTANATYASCLNNLALMNKHLGKLDFAMEQYIEVILHEFPIFVLTL